EGRDLRGRSHRSCQASVRRHGETRSIEPAADIAIVGRQIAIADSIWQPAACVRVGGVSPRKARREELARLKTRNPRQLPTADRVIQWNRHVGQKVPAASNRNLEQTIEDYSVSWSAVFAVPKTALIRIFQVQIVGQVVGPRPDSVEGCPAGSALRLKRQGVICAAAVLLGVIQIDELRVWAPRG